MRFFGLEITRGERRSTSFNPLDDRYYVPFEWNKATQSGMNVNPETAAKFCTVYTCVKIISETLGSIPLVLYKRGKGEQRDRATDHPLYRVLRARPNARQTAIEWREFMTASYLLTGNAYSEILTNRVGDVQQLIPLNPYAITPERAANSSELQYKLDLGNGKYRIIPQRKMFHIKMHSPDGVKGQSPISYFAELIGLGMELDSFESRFYANNASPAGIIQMGEDQELSPKAKERLRKEWKEKYSKSGVESNGIAVLEEGMEWKQIGIPAQDAQFLESKKFTDRRICGCFRVPPHMVGDLEKASLNNVEQMAIDFIQFTMLAHFTRWEEAVDTRLLSYENRTSEKYYAEFLIDNLQRADMMSRFRSYSIGRQWGWLSVNDIRQRENMNPVDGGDVYLQPMNMVDAEDADKLLDDGGVDPSGKGGKGKKKPAGVKGEDDDNSNVTLKNSLLLPNLTDTVKALEGKIFDAISDVKLTLSREISEKLEKKEEKPAEIVANEVKAPSFARTRHAAISAFSRTLARMMRKEMNYLKTARRKQSMENFDTSLYPDHFKIVTDEMRPLISSYCEQVRCLSSFLKRDFIADDAVSVAIERMLTEMTRRYSESYRDATEANVDEFASSLSVELAGIIESHTTSTRIIAELPPAPEAPAPPPPAPTTNVVVQVELPKEEKEDPAVGIEPYMREDGTRAFKVVRAKKNEKGDEKK